MTEHLALLSQDWLDVGNGHQVFVAQYGDPEGTPVLYLHGGPGAGCRPDDAALFAGLPVRLYLVDQRGAGRSRPYASVEHNHLIALLSDIEKLRQWANVEQWWLCGGSFGATLALLYSSCFPKRVSKQLLWGAFIPSATSIEWLYGRDGAAQIFSHHYQNFKGDFNGGDTAALIDYFVAGLQHKDELVRRQFHQRWQQWEQVLAMPMVDFSAFNYQGESLAKIEAHYAQAEYFEAEKILQQRANLIVAQTVILQGELDWVCPPQAVNHFIEQCDLSHLRLQIINHGYHALGDDKMRLAVISALRKMMNNRKDMPE
ncbi:alpha/beta fold hydrolase [Shewanella waksmanii]|uniref:alpha/beta fold hydrolase n=1 Tax=Shewanella waksmanii TaxID=213783 RepID=UPI003735FC26